MRTTLSIDDDVLEKARAAAEKAGLPFRTVINEALRAGLKTFGTPPEAVPYKTKPHKLGLKAGRNLDNIQELLAQVEGEDAR
jgi:antitoxin component of RelBE/YafQ-DinJ toxin-antitoxin module